MEEIREMLEIDLQDDMVKIREIKIVNQRPLILCESEKSCREIVSSGKLQTKVMTLS